jgi:cold shock CspA family protein
VTGTVVRFQPNRYGFITSDDGRELFLHASAVMESPALVPGERV